MRVLLACSLGGSGHLTPVVNVARAVGRLGHDAVVLVPPSLVSEIEREGLPYEVGGEPPRAVIDETWQRVRAGPAEAVVGLIDRELFADHCTRAMLPAARAVCDVMRPDLVVRESCEYGSAIVAAEAGIVQAQVGLSQACIEWGVLEMVSPTIERFGSGVASAIARAPYLSAFPASLDPSPWSDTRRFRQPAPPSRSALPDWWPGDHRPLVYLTFGSVIGHLPEAITVFRSALEAVAELPVRVLLTVGRATDVTCLGEIPANTHVESWIPQHDVLDHAAVVACHGGSGTVLGALTAGVPLVICPLFADQSANGRVIEGAHAGRVVAGRSLAPGSLRGLAPGDVAPLRDAIARVLNDSSYRQAARRIATELTNTPTLDTVLGSLLSQARAA
jgi:UDP:flavonoid glycosyltransferase YjiC (YdhE family)